MKSYEKDYNLMKKSNRCSVIGIIFDKERSKVIVVKRRDVPIWVLPGGGVEENESPKEAVVREVFEETGLNVVIERHVGTYFPINRLTYTTYVFTCSPKSGALSLGNETKKIGYFSIDQLPSPFFFLHQFWIEDAKKNLKYPIERFLTEVTYWELFKYFCHHPVQVFRLLLSRLGNPYNS
jgi:8-oxo-dGTP diphosphatase